MFMSDSANLGNIQTISSYIGSMSADNGSGI